MPRKKLLRRFEPRFGVTESMLETESKWLARELDDYLVLSRNKLREKATERHEKCRAAWACMCGLLSAIGEPERSAVQALLFRDFFHILELYRHHMTALDSPVREASPASPQTAPLEFSEWLFA